MSDEIPCFRGLRSPDTFGACDDVVKDRARGRVPASLASMMERFKSRPPLKVELMRDVVRRFDSHAGNKRRRVECPVMQRESR